MCVDWTRIEGVIKASEKILPFSGVILLEENGNVIHGRGYGLAQRAESIPNTLNTRFAMASGCKIFTAVAIGQLVDRGMISFDTLLQDCLDIRFPNFDPQVTIHHLLTHSSGIPDYFDEEVMDDYAALWDNRPMYRMRSPKDFLPMFQNNEMKFRPGQRFMYNDAAFIVLGLIVEQQSGMRFTEYIETNILKPCSMTDSGYFSTDQLPERTAYSYIHDETTGVWKTNFFAVPIIGAPDGGAYTTAPDMAKFWTALFDGKMLQPTTLEKFLTPHIKATSEGENQFYGYGIWIIKKDETIRAYYVTGSDPGVAFLSIVYPADNMRLTIIGNTEKPTWSIIRELSLLQ